MVKNLQYLYLGENGSILSPVKLPDVPCITKYKLTANSGCLLTKDDINFHKAIIIPMSELDLWREIEDKGQK